MIDVVAAIFSPAGAAQDVEVYMSDLNALEGLVDSQRHRTEQMLARKSHSRSSRLTHDSIPRLTHDSMPRLTHDGPVAAPPPPPILGSYRVQAAGMVQAAGGVSGLRCFIGCFEFCISPMVHL